jgi:hypothetical protein
MRFLRRQLDTSEQSTQLHPWGALWGAHPATLAKVEASSTAATASRACRITGWIRQISTSPQSAHGRNRVTLAQGVSTSGPSINRMMSAIEMVISWRARRIEATIT